MLNNGFLLIQPKEARIIVPDSPCLLKLAECKLAMADMPKSGAIEFAYHRE